MNNLTEVLEKLNKVTWTESQRTESIKGEFMNSEFEVTFRLEQGTMRHAMPMHCTIYVRIDNVQAFTWGCESIEDVALFNTWFLQTESKASRVQMEARDLEESRVKNLFEMM